jgi:LysM repeat protein
MIQKRTLIGILLAAALLGTVPVLSLAMPSPSWPAQEGTELLSNPGFEGISCRAGSEPGWCLDNWSNNANFDGTFHDNIFTPQGWVTWWRKEGNYGQPEVKTIPRVPPFTGELPRIRSGNYAVLLFTYYRLQDTGLYQIVTGLEPNATVQLSAHAHGWSCGDKDAKLGYTCGDPWNQTFQVGIAPDGVADPFSPNIVWSTAQNSPDHYSLIGPITAQVGEGGSVCVFLRSKTKWRVEHQDAYWDDASLVMTAPGTPPTATPLPPPPTPTYGPSPTPRATPTPRPDGATVHIVESGDTLFGIALMYSVDVNQIRQLNASSLGSNDIIRPGQALVISIPSETLTPTPLPAPPTPVPNSPATSVAEAEGGASICVLAYHDRDGSTFRDDATTEELLPNAEFTIADASGVVARYTSDGIHEPHCFTGLTPGAYRVILSPPSGYTPSGPAEWPVAVAEGTSLDIQFGNVRNENTSPDETSKLTPADEEDNEPASSSTASRILATVAKVSGIMVLVLAVGVAVLFVLNRRRM